MSAGLSFARGETKLRASPLPQQPRAPALCPLLPQGHRVRRGRKERPGTRGVPPAISTHEAGRARSPARHVLASLCSVTLRWALAWTSAAPQSIPREERCSGCRAPAATGTAVPALPALHPCMAPAPWQRAEQLIQSRSSLTRDRARCRLWSPLCHVPVWQPAGMRVPAEPRS